MGRPIFKAATPRVSLLCSSCVVAGLSFLFVLAASHHLVAAQDDFVRFSKPDLFTFGELVDLEKNDPPSPALAEKLEHLLNTPFLNNEEIGRASCRERV